MADTGRPSDYNPDYCEMLIEHMSQGLSFESFAGVIGVCRTTIYNWISKDPGPFHQAFLNAKKIGNEKSRLWWERQAVNGLVTTKGTTFNSAIWIYNMKCRFRDEWNDTPSTIKLFAEKVQGLSKEETIKFFEEELKNLKSESE